MIRRKTPREPRTWRKQRLLVRRETPGPLFLKSRRGAASGKERLDSCTPALCGGRGGSREFDSLQVSVGARARARTPVSKSLREQGWHGASLSISLPTSTKQAPPLSSQRLRPSPFSQPWLAPRASHDSKHMPGLRARAPDWKTRFQATHVRVSSWVHKVCGSMANAHSTPYRVATKTDFTSGKHNQHQESAGVTL